MVKAKSTATATPNDTEQVLGLGIAVSDRVQVRDVRLLGSNCRQTPLALKGQLNVRLSHNVTTKANPEERQVLVFPTFRLLATSSEATDDQIAVQIEASFLLAYTAEDLHGLEARHFEAFGRFNGVYNAWPYWREYVQSTLGRMGLPGFTVPVFRIAAPKQSLPKTLPPKHAESSRRGRPRQ